MNLDYLKYFVKLAELEHYTHASEALNITQPSLSYAISSLEDELGVKLFEKTGRNIQLTAAGKIFRSYVVDALDILSTATTKMEHIKRGNGHIRIGTLEILSHHFVPKIARDFLESNKKKKISFSFDTSSGLSQDIIMKLTEDKFDLAFCSKINTFEEITYIPFVKQELVLIVPNDHPLSAYDKINLEDTLSYGHIFVSKESGIRSLIDNFYGHNYKKTNICYEVSKVDSVAGLVSENFGIAVVPKIPFLKLMNINIIPLTNPDAYFFYYMAYLTNKYRAPVIDELITYIKDYYIEDRAQLHN